MTESVAATAQRFLAVFFAERNELSAYKQFAHPDFIQHDPAIQDGLDGLAAYYGERRAPIPARVVNLIMLDGDRFAVHHHGFESVADRGRVSVEIWRIADGKICEHWNIAQEVPEVVRHGNTMWCSKGSDYRSAKALDDTARNPAGGFPDPSASREATIVVVETYLRGVGQGKVRDSIEQWTAPNYIQHSPHIEDGMRGAIDYLLTEFGHGDACRPSATLSHVLAQGDLVLHHRHVVRPNGPPRGNVQADIFRVTKGRISEHWDVKQDVPAQSLNRNTMW